MQCIISRLNEPNIARLYPVEPDQNLVNNIRVLCTKYRETFCYFVPRERFHDIRNGYTIPTRAACCDEGGEWILEIDPLKVISEQLRDAGIMEPYRGHLEIRIGVDGYELPDPAGEAGFLKRPAGYTGMAAHVRKKAASEARGSEAAARAGKAQSAGRSASHVRSRPSFGPGSAARILSRILMLLLMIVVIAGGIFYIKNGSVNRFRKEMRAGNYREAVSIYNEKIMGNQSRESNANPIAVNGIERIESGYLGGTVIYKDACADLDILTGIGNGELSELARDTKTRVEVYESSSLSYKEGLALLEEKKIIDAIKKFQEVPEAAAVYQDAQDRIDTCVELLARAGSNVSSEEEYRDALAQFDAALELLPGDSGLTEGRAACTARYENMVRNSAVSDADALSASGEYGGALVRIREALQILPGDERLESRYNEYLSAYKGFVKKETAACVNNGNFEDAQNLVAEASQISECDEFTSLAEQLQEAQDYGGDMTPEVYSAADVVFVTFEGKISSGKSAASDQAGKAKENSGTVKASGSEESGKAAGSGENSEATGEGKASGSGESSEASGSSKSAKIAKSVRHNFKTPESGNYEFQFTSVSGKLKVKLSITSSDGEEIVSESGLAKGGTVTCRLSENVKYTAEVSAVEGKGSYVLNVGQPKTAVDISDYDEVEDSIEYSGQENIYRFVPGVTGIYRIELARTEEDEKLDLSICGQDGYEVNGEEALQEGEGLTEELHSGEQYEIHAGFVNKKGAYEIKLGRQAAAEEITGKSIVSGRVAFEGQKIVYTYVAEESGRYVVTPANMPDDMRTKIFIYDSLGYKIGGGEDLCNGESVTADLEAGQSCQIHLFQSGGAGRYTVTIVRESE